MKVWASLFISAASVASSSALATSRAEVCATQDNHGCSAFCGFEAVLAGGEYICMPATSSMDTPGFPFAITDDDRAEYCEMVSARHGCDDICGFKWDDRAARCRSIDAIAATAPKATLHGNSQSQIIGGQGKFRYLYRPDLVVAPQGAVMVNCHGLILDNDKNIYLTYQNDGKTDENCLIPGLLYTSPSPRDRG